MIVGVIKAPVERVVPFCTKLILFPMPPFNEKLAAVWNGMNYGRKRSETSKWLAIKWFSLFAFTDFDWRPPDDFLEEAATDKKLDEPWLLAQLAKYFLFADRYVDLEDQLERSLVMIPLMKRLISSVHTNHWISKNVSPQETTAIVSQFLFHPGVQIFLAKVRDKLPGKVESGLSEEIEALRTPVFAWLANDQRDDGSWEGSPAITAHCVEALTTSLENQKSEDGSNYVVDKSSVVCALQWLLSDQVINWWDELRSYQQIGVLLLLKKLSSVALFSDVFDGAVVSSQRVTRDVFISYGGVDREFAHRLATDLESRGIRVWFAEWDIDYGDDIFEEIQKGLDETTKFLIVLSPESVGRRWVRQELSAAFHRALDLANTVVIPIMFKQCEPPAFVRTKKWADFTDPDRYNVNIIDLARRLKIRKIKRK
jgi:hypothetical protein